MRLHIILSQGVPAKVINRIYKMTDNSLVFRTYKWVLFLCALHSFACWFFFDLNNLLASLVLAFFSSLLFLYKKTDSNKYYVKWFFLYIIAFVFTQDNNLLGWVALSFYVWSIYVLFCLKTELKQDVLITFRIGLSILIGVSLIGWIAFLSGVSLPYEIVGYLELPNGGYQYNFENYYFFLLNTDTIFRYILPRFNSVFIEPGYLGCLMTIMLYADDFQFGKGHRANFIFLIALILSFSLAGWLLSIASFVLVKLHSSKMRLLIIGGLSLIIVLAIPFIKNYNGGDNIVNETILLRLEYDDYRGTISGYNRSSEQVDKYFWDTFIFSPQVVFGDKDTLERIAGGAENEVSWTGYIMRFGIIAFIFLTLYYLYPFNHRKKEKYRLFCLFSLFFILFTQTTPMIHSLMYIALLVLNENRIIHISLTKHTDYGNNSVLFTSISSHKK